MDYKTFIIEAEKLSATLLADTLRAVSWPIAAMVIVLLLREPISKLIPLLRKLKYKDAEAIFSDQLDKAEIVAVNIEGNINAGQSAPEVAKADTGPKPPQAVDEAMTLLLDLSKLPAETVILEAFRQFEKATREAAGRISLSIPLKATVRAIVEKLYQTGKFPVEMHRLFQSLISMRNEVAHNQFSSISTADASRFVSLIAPLTAYMKNLEPEVHPDET